MVTESGGAGSSEIVKAWLTADAPPLSVTVTVKVELDSVVPELQGVPEIVAVRFVVDVVKWRQGGSVGLLNM